MSSGSHCYASEDRTEKDMFTSGVKEQGACTAGRGWIVRSAVHSPRVGPAGLSGVTRMSALFANILILLTFRELLRPFLFLPPEGWRQLMRPPSLSRVHAELPAPARHRCSPGGAEARAKNARGHAPGKRQTGRSPSAALRAGPLRGGAGRGGTGRGRPRRAGGPAGGRRPGGG